MKRVNKLVEQLEEAKLLKNKKCNIEIEPIASYHLENNSNNKSSFRYTLDKSADKVFTKKQREFYDKNGFIVIKKLLSKEDCKFFSDRFDALVQNPKLRRPEMTVMRDVSLKHITRDKKIKTDVITKLQLWARDEELWKYPSHPLIKKYSSAFCGDNIRAMHFMVINKPPDSGELSSRHPFHQDQWYFPYGPSDHIVCAWTALQRIGRFNGGLSVVPGTHRASSQFPYAGQLIHHDYPSKNTGWTGLVNKGYHCIQLPGNEMNKLLRNRLHLEMDTGDTVFFHPLLFHSSGTNLSNAFRRSISAHFASSKLCYYQSYKENGQHLIMEKTFKYSGIFKKQPHRVWSWKSRQVCGDSANLGPQVANKLWFN